MQEWTLMVKQNTDHSRPELACRAARTIFSLSNNIGATTCQHRHGPQDSSVTAQKNRPKNLLRDFCLLDDSSCVFGSFGTSRPQRGSWRSRHHIFRDPRLPLGAVTIHIVTAWMLRSYGALPFSYLTLDTLFTYSLYYSLHQQFLLRVLFIGLVLISAPSSHQM